MNRREADAVLSLARTDDWKHLIGYIEGAVIELQAMIVGMDPNDAVAISRIQGAHNALGNLLSLEESALEIHNGEDTNE